MNKSKSTLFAVPAFLLATHLFAEQIRDVDIVKLSSATNAVVSTGAGVSSLPAAYVPYTMTTWNRYDEAYLKSHYPSWTYHYATGLFKSYLYVTPLAFTMDKLEKYFIALQKAEGDFSRSLAEFVATLGTIDDDSFVTGNIQHRLDEFVKDWISSNENVRRGAIEAANFALAYPKALDRALWNHYAAVSTVISSISNFGRGA